MKREFLEGLELNGVKLTKDLVDQDVYKRQVWDSKEAEKGKDVRLDNFSSDIDILDAFEYSWERFIPKLIPDRR